MAYGSAEIAPFIILNRASFLTQSGQGFCQYLGFVVQLLLICFTPSSFAGGLEVKQTTNAFPIPKQKRLGP